MATCQMVVSLSHLMLELCQKQGDLEGFGWITPFYSFLNNLFLFKILHVD